MLLPGLAGCQKSGGTLLGQAPAGPPQTVQAIQSLNRAGARDSAVLLTGVMIDKCPVAGCWFHLRDGTGTIKVDTKSSGFVVVNVPLQSNVKVSGRIVADGDQLMLEATGLRY
jgi:uncharacterized protein YdeI (BOF family)